MIEAMIEAWQEQVDIFNASLERSKQLGSTDLRDQMAVAKITQDRDRYLKLIEMAKAEASD